MTILQFAPRPLDSLTTAKTNAATEYRDPRLSTSPCEDSGKILLDDLSRFLRRNSAVTKELERQIVCDMDSLAVLFNTSNSSADLHKVEQLAVAVERLKGLERMKSRLNYLSEQQIEETKGRLELLNLEPLDLPMENVLASSGMQEEAARQKPHRDFLPAFLGLDELTAMSVTYVDLTNIFDNCDEMPSIYMS